MRTTRRLTVAGGLALVLLAGACGGGDDEKEVTFSPATAPSPSLLEALPAGLPGEEAAARNTFVGLAGEASKVGVALVRHGDEVAVYLCDGQGVSDWFAGRLDGESLRLESREGTRLDATLGGSGFSGTIAVAGGQPIAFTAPPAEVGKTGILVRRQPDGAHRWILTADAIYGAFEDGGGKTVATTSATSTSSSGATSGSTLDPSKIASDPCAGNVCGGMSCGQLEAYFDAHATAYFGAKTKLVKDSYLNAMISISGVAGQRGCAWTKT